MSLQMTRSRLRWGIFGTFTRYIYKHTSLKKIPILLGELGPSRYLCAKNTICEHSGQNVFYGTKFCFVVLRADTLPAVLPGSLARQSCPAVLPSSLARQSCPAVLPGSLARQSCPAVLPGSLARHPCTAP
jgi:hypothetical protein